MGTDKKKEKMSPGQLKEQSEKAERLYKLGCSDLDNERNPKDNFLKAAKLGHIQAQFSLGLHFELGNRFDQSWEKAVAWYKEAAKQGHKNAVTNLGAIAKRYEKGDGVKKNPEKAEDIRKFLKGCEYFEKGLCYEQGEEVEKNVGVAVQFYRVAISMGHPQAQQRLKDLMVLQGKQKAELKKQFKEQSLEEALEGWASGPYSDSVTFFSDKSKVEGRELKDMKVWEEYTEPPASDVKNGVPASSSQLDESERSIWRSVMSMFGGESTEPAQEKPKEPARQTQKDDIYVVTLRGGTGEGGIQ